LCGFLLFIVCNPRASKERGIGGKLRGISVHSTLAGWAINLGLGAGHLTLRDKGFWPQAKLYTVRLSPIRAEKARGFANFPEITNSFNVLFPHPDFFSLIKNPPALSALSLKPLSCIDLGLAT
jgi:hypothetical protein